MAKSSLFRWKRDFLFGEIFAKFVMLEIGMRENLAPRLSTRFYQSVHILSHCLGSWVIYIPCLRAP